MHQLKKMISEKLTNLQEILIPGTNHTVHLLHGDKGFDMAIAESIKRKVLPGYLEIKTMEVRNMVLEEYDYATEIAVLKEEAEERGEQRGSDQAKLETARAFKEMGLPILQIARGTGLSIEEIEKL